MQFIISVQDVEKAIISTLGSDVTEHACEAGCPTVINAIPGGSLVSGYLCPQACKRSVVDGIKSIAKLAGKGIPLFNDFIGPSWAQCKRHQRHA